jgi:glycosyltransferase involved in cell wall biosynthesis
MQQHDTLLIIPAYNEAANLPRVLAAVERANLGLPVLVIDDGSRDETATLARRAGARVVRHPYNLGYGAAVQTGYKYALEHGAERLVQLDADGQHDPSQVPRLLGPVVRGECDLALGSRFIGPSSYRMSPLQRVGRRLFCQLARLFGMAISDPTSGFQAMNRRVLELYAQPFFPTDFPDVDVLLHVHRQGLRIREVPVEMSAGTRASSLHGGLATFYYPYKMLLALWATPPRVRPAGPAKEPSP